MDVFTNTTKDRKGPQSKPNDAGVKSNQGALGSIWQRIPSSKLHNFGLISAIRKLHNKNTHPVRTKVVTVTSNRASTDRQQNFSINKISMTPTKDLLRAKMQQQHKGGLSGKSAP